MTTDPITKEIDKLEKELGAAAIQLAIQLVVTLIVVACLAFGLGYFTGIN